MKPPPSHPPPSHPPRLKALIENIRWAAFIHAIRIAPEDASPKQIGALQEALLRPCRAPQRRGQKTHERLP